MIGENLYQILNRIKYIFLSIILFKRTEALATQIFNDCNNQPLICLCVLKSGYKFFSDLTEKIQSRNRTNGKKSLPMKIDFIQVNVNSII